MPAYLMEFFVALHSSRPDGPQAAGPELLARAGQAAEALEAEGTVVRLLYALEVPEEELCLCFFEAPSPGAVAEVARRAGFPPDCRPEPVTFVGTETSRRQPQLPTKKAKAKHKDQHRHRNRGERG
ncbi:MAG: nickel-binding protein [Acidimicrobiales bacterium]